MKKLLAPLLLSASLAAPVEIEAKTITIEEPTKIEITQSAPKVNIQPEFQLAQATEDEWTDEDTEAFGAAMLFLLACAIGIYFIPTAIAMMRGSNLTAAVFIINLFLGWTGIFYILALVMAVLPKGQKQQTIIIQQSSDGTANTTTTTTPGGVEKITY